MAGESVFVTGVTGYIGGSVAESLVKTGYRVSGLTRSESKAPLLRQRMIEPVVGSLDDSSLLAEHASSADIVINAASSDHAGAVEALLDSMAGSGKLYIQNSGSTVVAERGSGDRSEDVYDETVFDPSSDFVPDSGKQARVLLDRKVRDASKNGFVPVVICPCLIYGEGLGLSEESQQVPLLVEQALESGTARCVGKGKNIWSTVHIQDLCDLYLSVVKSPPAAGTFLFAENGEVSFWEIATRIAECLELTTDAQEWPVEKAIERWGEGAVVYALASNSRIRAKRSRELGWQPRHDNLLEDIARCCQNLSSKRATSISNP